MSSSVPKQFQPLLPSSPVENLDAQRDYRYILGNLLHNSDLAGWRWMMKTYSKDQIIEAVRNTRHLHPRDALFWATYYNIPREEIRCLQPEWRQLHKQLWSY